MNNMGMKQYVNKPTRITKQSRSIIDLVFFNKEIKVSMMYESMVTDHTCLKIEQKGGRIESKYRKYIARYTIVNLMSIGLWRHCKTD